MRSYRSDPVLIKPSRADFLNDWNFKFSMHCTSFEPDGRSIRITDFERIDMPKDLSDTERQQYERRLEKRAKRRQSIVIANIKEFKRDELHRCSSVPDITDELYNLNQKRVSFTVKAESNQYPSYVGDRRTTLSVANLSLPKKPILLRKNRCSSMPLHHMDFESFTAWRRGSRISDEVDREHSRKSRIKDSDSGWWSSPSNFVKSFVLRCLHSKRNRTSPQQVLICVS